MTGAEQRSQNGSLNLRLTCPSCSTELWMNAILVAPCRMGSRTHRLQLIKVFPVRPELTGNPALQLARLLPSQESATPLEVKR